LELFKENPIIKLKKGREKSVNKKHPWVFSGAIANMDGEIPLGETVAVLSHENEFLAWGAYSPSSRIRIRLWSWNENELITEEFLMDRIRKSFQERYDLGIGKKTNALRMVHAESDGLPGLIVDRYKDMLVVQFLSAGVEYWRSTIVNILRETPGIAGVYERSDAEVRRLEGLELRTGILSGVVPNGLIEIDEQDVKFLVDFRHGHKTGFYIDQRENRKKVQEFVKGKHVLDCFSYTGGFLINSLEGGADTVVSVEASGNSIELAKQNLALNEFQEEKVHWIQGDVFNELRKFRDKGQNFDLIILDPPKFAPTKSQAQRAARGYKDINLLALKLLSPGGILFTFSCSGGINQELFQKIVAGAALDANVNTQIIGHLEQSADHPIALNFPEGSYLKGLIIRKQS